VKIGQVEKGIRAFQKSIETFSLKDYLASAGAVDGFASV